MLKPILLNMYILLSNNNILVYILLAQVTTLRRINIFKVEILYLYALIQNNVFISIFDYLYAIFYFYFRSFSIILNIN